MNDFYLEQMARIRMAELLAEADRERVARRLTDHHLRLAWVRYAVSALGGRLTGFRAPIVATQHSDV